RGELGSVSDPALAPEGDVAGVRVAELLASAGILGAARVVQLDHGDGCLRWADGLDTDVAAVLDAEAPAAVVTFDADGLYWHTDHLGVHERTTRAVEALGARAPALYYVTFAPGAMRSIVDAAHARGGARDGGGLWGISPDAFGTSETEPTLELDVRPWMPRKLAAIRSHQIGRAHV